MSTGKNTGMSSGTSTVSVTVSGPETSARSTALSMVVGTADTAPEAIASLLDVLVDHDVDHALIDLEQTIARLRVGAEQAAQARRILRDISPQVLREAMWLGAARVVEATR